jgi:hypothetical protein
MRSILLLACAVGLAFAARNPQLEAIQTVYLLPMGNSLDQYLATRLTSTGMFQVVTDPQKADAVFTDKIGQAFETKLDELYPPEVKKTDEDDENDGLGAPAQRLGSFSRSRGTVFLVDRRTRNVVWSIYWPIRNTRPDAVNRRAEQIADRLRKDLKATK